MTVAQYLMFMYQAEAVEDREKHETGPAGAAVFFARFY